ncbi:MAG: DJ-1/PfpI family protein [Actinobacteria bacterium]|nr:DJ-1/PfpI family protein [Actinomycetota bacterium]
MSLTGKKVLFVIAPGNFRDEEFEIPFNRLVESGAEITVASLTTHKATGMFGLEVMPDATIYEVHPSSFDAVVFIGGSGASVFFEDQTAQMIAREAMNQRKILAAICIAPAILANAGILANRRVTAFETVKPIVEREGGQCTGLEIQRDGNLLTGCGPTAALQFAEELVIMLGGAG